MAKTPNKAKDATEEAMSAIQEALKVRDAEMKSPPARVARPANAPDTEIRPDPAIRAGRIASSGGDDDLFGEMRIESEPRRPANDDRRSMGQILQGLQSRTSRTGYIAAAIGSVAWIVMVGLLASNVLPDLRNAENLGLAILALAAVFVLPPILFFVLAHMINRSREMRLVAQSMAEVAMRLGEPEAVARESLVTVGQAIRREVAAMGDGVERALARAAELETLVHNEVSALERAYNDNEVRIRGLLEDLNRQHDNLVTSAGQVRDAIKGVHLDLTQDIASVSDLVGAQVTKAASEISQTLTEKGLHITQALAQTGDTMISAIGERGGDLLQRLESTSYETQSAISQASEHLSKRLEATSYETQTALAQASDQLFNSLNFKTDHIPQEFEMLAENLTQMMQLRLANVTNDFAQRASGVVDLMAERSEQVTAGYLDTTSRLAEAIALRGDEVNNTIKATGDSLILDLSLRGGDVATKLEQTAGKITESLVTRSDAAVEAFNKNAEMLASSISARGDTVRDMLTSRMQAFEEMFTRGGAELAERIGHDSAMLGNLITKNLSEFDRTVKTYGGELIERLGERTDRVAQAMGEHIDNFDGRVSGKVDELTGTLDERLDKFTQAFDSRSQALTSSFDTRSQSFTEALEARSKTLTDAMSGRVMDIAKTLAEGGKEVVGALDKRIEEITSTINTRGSRLAETIDTKISEIDRTLGSRALEVAGTLDDRITKFEDLLIGRAEKLAEEVETRTRAAAGALDTSNDAIRNSTENLERMLMTVSAGVGEGLKQNAGEVEKTLLGVSTNVSEALRANASDVERTLLGVSAEVARTFVGKADEINTAVSERATEMTRILDSSSSTLLASLTSKSQDFTNEVGRATEAAVSAIEAKGFDFTRTMLDNSGELARLINEAGESASGKVAGTLESLQSAANEAIDRTQATTSAAVSEMVETHNMLRTDTVSLFERLREANILLQEVMSGSQDNMVRLETALAGRVTEFATVMNDVTARTGHASNLVSDQIQSFQGVTTKVVEDLSDLALQFDAHGRVLVQAVELVDASNRKADASIDERRAHLDSLISTLDLKSAELEQRLKRFSSLLEESLENSATRARDIGRLIAETSSQGTQTIVEQFDLVRNSAEQERKRTKDTMQSLYDQAMSDTHAVFRQSTERFADVLSGIKQMAAEMQNELDATRAELRKGILEMPAETAETTAQMRRVIIDQIEALAELNRIVARHGRVLENNEPRRAQEPALTVVGGGRAAPRPAAPRQPNNSGPDLPEPPAPLGPQRPRRAPANEAPPISPAPASGKQSTGWLSDLLQRASRDDAPENNLRVEDRPARAEERQARHSIESLDALSVDIARMIDHDAAAELWDRYNRGERNVFTRRLYTLQGQQAFDEIRKRYRSDREFKQTVDRYIAEFERLLEDVSRDDRGQVVVRTYLTSETGKVYTMLAHAAGRFD